ncbi:hypothetical protein HJC23_010714, partial [Cyclotella cryptica]
RLSSKGGKSTSSDGKSGKGSFNSKGKSGKSSSYSKGKSGKSSNNEPHFEHENDVASDGKSQSSLPARANGSNSNDVGSFLAQPDTNAFLPIIFQAPDPVAMMQITDNPTSRPTASLSLSPIMRPTKLPTSRPTIRPTKLLTEAPTTRPTPFPTPKPSLKPLTQAPVTTNPTNAPTGHCQLSESSRSEQIREIINSVSLKDDLVDPTSPQSLALDWITNKDSLRICPGNKTRLIQRYVAAVFYFSTGGGSWKQCNAPKDFDDPVSVERANAECQIEMNTFPDQTSGSQAWLTASSECEWGGLACLPETSSCSFCLGELSFENNGLIGTIPSELKEWVELRRLALQQGGLRGTIPTELSSLSNLLVFDLDYNELSGTLSAELLESWKDLKELDLNNNSLSGTISSRIGRLTDLRFLQLDSNDFTGTLPSQLGDLKMLIFMSVVDLNLNGIMPPQVCTNRGEPNDSNNGNLAVLIADCTTPDPKHDSAAKVFCECCSDCGIQKDSTTISQFAPFWIAQRNQPH